MQDGMKEFPKRGMERVAGQKKGRGKGKTENYTKRTKSTKKWGAFVIKEQMGAGDMEKMGLHIEKLKFTRKEGEMENIIL